jgi:hypothetical protein
MNNNDVLLLDLCKQNGLVNGLVGNDNLKGQYVIVTVRGIGLHSIYRPGWRIEDRESVAIEVFKRPPGL